MTQGKPATLRAVCYRTTDMSQAVDFYISALGLELRFADGERWAEFNAGGAKLALGAPSELPFGADGSVAIFDVDSLESFRGRVVSAGGSIESARDMGDHGSYLAIRDPAGNSLLLFARAER